MARFSADYYYIVFSKDAPPKPDYVEDEAKPIPYPSTPPIPYPSTPIDKFKADETILAACNEDIIKDIIKKF